MLSERVSPYRSHSLSNGCNTFIFYHYLKNVALYIFYFYSIHLKLRLLIIDNCFNFFLLTCSLFSCQSVLRSVFYWSVFLLVHWPGDISSMFSNERYSNFNIFCLCGKKFYEKSSSKSYWRQTVDFFSWMHFITLIW